MKSEKEHFDSVAGQWAEDTAAAERALFQLSLMEKQVTLRPGLSCLDAGGGTGALASLVADKTGDVTVADTSEGMLAVLAQRIAGMNPGTLKSLAVDVSARIPSLLAEKAGYRNIHVKTAFKMSRGGKTFPVFVLTAQKGG
jgi:SAM-dependent methyltransferase